MRLRILRCLAIWMPSRSAHSSTMRTEVVPMCLAKPWTYRPLESRMRPPPLALCSITEVSVFNLNQPERGLIQLQLARAFGMWEREGVVRKWNSRALAIQSYSNRSRAEYIARPPYFCWSKWTKYRRGREGVMGYNGVEKQVWRCSWREANLK